MTGLTIHSPEHLQSKDEIAKFNVKISMGVTEACKALPAIKDAGSSWDPGPIENKPLRKLADVWRASESKAKDAVSAWTNLLWGDGREPLTGAAPEKLLDNIQQLYLQAPRIGLAA